MHAIREEVAAADASACCLGLRDMLSCSRAPEGGHETDDRSGLSGGGCMQFALQYKSAERETLGKQGTGRGRRRPHANGATACSVKYRM